MAVNQATNDSFDHELSSDVPVIVDFWAAWCGPCRALSPVLDKLAEEYDGRIKVVKVDIVSNKKLAQQYGVTSIPFLGVFKDGEMVESHVGFGGYGSIEKIFKDAVE